MKKLGLGFVLAVLAVSACDNKLPPTKAPGAEQSLGAEQNLYAAINPVANTSTAGK